VTAKTNSSGAVSARYDYDPTVLVTCRRPAPQARLTSDRESSATRVATGPLGGMYHFGQRFYDPAGMRWTQPDPLDQTGDLREGNRYSYSSDSAPARLSAQRMERDEALKPEPMSAPVGRGCAVRPFPTGR
jgi:hypothetical protein